MDLWRSTGGPRGAWRVTSGWDSDGDADPCGEPKWFGIESCSVVGGASRVTTLFVATNGLSGTLPDELTDLNPTADPRAGPAPAADCTHTIDFLVYSMPTGGLPITTQPIIPL